MYPNKMRDFTLIPERNILEAESDEEEFKLTYESPHASLTEVVGRVTVSSRCLL